MPRSLNIGTATTPADDLVQFTVRTGDTVVVTNLAASPGTLNHLDTGHSGGITGTVSAGANLSFSVPGTYYLSANTRATSVTISGGMYGN